MDRVNLLLFVDLWNKSDLRKDYIFTQEDKNIYNFVTREMQHNQELTRFIKSISSLSADERIKKVEEYFGKEEKVEEKPEEVIAKTYGIDITQVENINLKNGNELFKFYSNKLGRDVILENRKDGKSLVEQLKEIQLNNEQYQSNNNQANTNNILENERNKDNVELKMIRIDEIKNYPNITSSMKPEELKKLNYIILNAELLEVEKLNLTNLIYITKEHKLVEVIYDKEKDEVKSNIPNELETKEKEINPSDNINIEPSSDYVEDNHNAYEEKKTTLENYETYEEIPENLKKQIETFINYPELLDVMGSEEKQKWQRYINLYEEQNKEIKKEEALNNKPKQYVKRKNKKTNSGYVSAFALFALTGFTGGVIATVLTLLLS